MDAPWWRHPAFFPDLDYARLEDLPAAIQFADNQMAQGFPQGLNVMPLSHQFSHADFMSALKKAEIIRDDLDVYRKGPKSKWVYRMWRPIFDAFNPDGTAPWSQIRKVKFYDGAGRVNKNTWAKVLTEMNVRRLPRNKLDQYLR